MVNFPMKAASGLSKLAVASSEDLAVNVVILFIVRATSIERYVVTYHEL